MKKTRFLSLIATLLLAAVAMAAYVWKPGPMPDNGRAANLPTSIRLGEPKDSDFSGWGASVDNHPSGMRFYERDWVRGNPGVVEIEHGKYSFVIDIVLSATGVSDADIPGGVFKSGSASFRRVRYAAETKNGPGGPYSLMLWRKR